MFRKTAICLFVVVLLVPALSCTRMPEKAAPVGPVLATEQLPAPDAIPAAWGKLVSVTTNPAYPNWFQLWFEDETGTVRMAAYNHRTGQFDTKATVFARR